VLDNNRVYVEDSPAARQLMREAEQLLESDRANRAARKLQQVLEQYPDKLVRQSNGVYIDATQVVRKKVRGNDNLLAAYNQTFSTAANRRLEQALQPRSAP